MILLKRSILPFCCSSGILNWHRIRPTEYMSNASGRAMNHRNGARREAMNGDGDLGRYRGMTNCSGGQYRGSKILPFGLKFMPTLISAAAPKSIILTLPVFVIRMLEGFTSLCTMPVLCIFCRFTRIFQITSRTVAFFRLIPLPLSSLPNMYSSKLYGKPEETRKSRAVASLSYLHISHCCPDEKLPVPVVSPVLSVPKYEALAEGATRCMRSLKYISA
mmetsp:Transcript_9571/g.35084  ORF Transcript_9571/g.35084 Transcript_9571/m.35084 type:complete len:219 (+) Transcript_9571:320-976(+)